MDNVVEQVRESFKSGVTRPLQWRISQISSILLMLSRETSTIQDALFKDLGKSPFQSYMTELSVVERSCKQAKKMLKKWTSPTKVGSNLIAFPSKASIVPEPYGVVLIISSWNFPFVLMMDPLIGAIAAGNAVVLKPSEIASSTENVIMNLIPRYMDPSSIKVVTGDSSVASALLEYKWDKIFFTGSPTVGRIVMGAAAKHLCPVTLELGGKCPALVDCNMDLQVVARRLAFGKWGCNNGQTCISVDYVLVHQSVADSLIEKLEKTIKDFYGTDPHKSGDISKIVNLKSLLRLQEMLKETEVEKKIVYGGRSYQNEKFMEPTIVVDPPTNSSLMEEEIFGPILVIIKVSSMLEAIEFVKNRAKPLVVYAFTNNKPIRKTLKREVSAGAIVLNDTIMHFLVENLPFGGVGNSGMGSYHGKFSFDAFSHQKAVLERSTHLDMKFRYPPYTSFKISILSAFFKSPHFSLKLVCDLLFG